MEYCEGISKVTLCADLDWECQYCRVRDYCAHPSEQIQLYGLLQIPGQLSGILLGIIGGLILLTDGFKAHPYPLIGWTCLSESMQYFSQTPSSFMCLYSTSDYVKGDNINSFTIVVYGQTYLQLISQLLSFYLNFLILIDLYLSITNPFKNRNKRIKWYFVGTIVMMVLGIVILGCLSRGFRSLQDILSEFFFY